MKKTILLLSTLFVLFTTSCKSTLASATSTPLAVTEDIRPLDADITVDTKNKISGQSKTLYFLFFRLSGDSTRSGLTGLFSAKVNKAKAAAAYKAVKSSGCDVIVHPNYEVDVEDYVFFKKINVKVTGYAGTINRIYQQEHCDGCSNDYKGIRIKN
jgi:hypothetical protein